MPLRPHFEVDIEHDFPGKIGLANAGDYWCEFRLGYCMDTEEAAMMSVMLVPGSSFSEDYDGYFDLRFGIRFNSLKYDWKVSGLSFDKETAMSVVRPADRPIVLSHTLRAIWILVKKVKPPNITMTTYYAELPPEAMVKYEKVERLLRELGYQVIESTRDADGYDRWHFAT